MAETIDFEEHIAEELTILLSKEKLIEIITDLSHREEILGYLDGTSDVISKLVQNRDILSNASDPLRCETLIDRLDEKELDSLSRLVLGFKTYAEKEDVTEIVNATFLLNETTEEGIVKAGELISALNGRDEILELLGIDLITLSKQLYYLGWICIGYKNQKHDDAWPSKIAGIIGEANLDYLVEISKTIMKTRMVIVPKYYEV